MNRERDNKGRFIKGHKKVGGVCKGDVMSEESKEKIRQSLIGKTGVFARNWQGGKTKEGQIIRSSRRFQELRGVVFKRDNYTCVLCGKKSGNGKAVVLHLDHIKPFAYFPSLRFELSNCRTLCRECHKETDTFAYRAIKNYA